MKRILFIAPHAFPIKSSESICNSKVAQSLAEAGYKVDVFTCKDNSAYPSDQKIDDFFSSSTNLKIYYVNYTYILSRQYSLFKNLKNALINLFILLKTGYWYNGISVPFGIVSAVNKHIKEYDQFPYDVVITRGFLTDYVGIYFSKKYKIKWIANWNDPYPTKRFPAPYGDGYDAKLPFFENRIYQSIQRYADIHTFPSDRLRNYMLKCFININESQTMVIPHMAHSRLLSIVKGERKGDRVFRIVHCGSVARPRNPEIFIKALSKMVSGLELTKNQLRCYFVGSYDSNLSEIIKNNKVDDIVELLPPKKYADSLSFISSCDMALIIEAECEEGIYLPTKFVDAIQSGLPVFCVSPFPGTLNDMVEKYAVGFCANNTSIDDVENKLINAYNDFLNNNLPEMGKEKLGYFFEENIVSLLSAIIE